MIMDDNLDRDNTVTQPGPAMVQGPEGVLHIHTVTVTVI